MNLVSVNVGTPTAMPEAKGQTGIYKVPQAGPVFVGTLGLTGDAICDTKNHGGPDQAVYLYTVPDYAWWSRALGRALAPGTFGENLTLSALESATLYVGERFEIGGAGGVVLEVSAPRIPCVTLATRMNDLAFVKRFRTAERPGVYCRVVQDGHVEVGDAVRRIPHSSSELSVLEMFRDFFKPDLGEATLERHLAAPIAARDRESTRAALEHLQRSR